MFMLIMIGCVVFEYVCENDVVSWNCDCMVGVGAGGSSGSGSGSIIWVKDVWNLGSLFSDARLVWGVDRREGVRR